MNLNYIFLFISLCIFYVNCFTKTAVIEDIVDVKQLKKLYRTKTNVLVLYVSTPKDAQNTIKIFRDAAELIKGHGTMVLMDCSHTDKKKLCKTMKVVPQPAVLKHYKDGNFHKDYDRQVVVSSLVNFMRDPTGDLPWDEDSSSADVMHIQDAKVLAKYLKKELKPIMVMFYAPWCGFCQKMKPDYSAAATELKPNYILAAIDANRPENSIIKRLYNITGFPTLQYYEHGELKHVYEGENTKDGIVAFMRNPNALPVQKPKEVDWASETTSDIVHLTSSSFEPALKDESSVLVMFYAPWCGHCKRMKPQYEKAAQLMKEQKIPGVLAALDATKENDIGAEFNVKGYPTVKYFVNGEFKFDVNIREAEQIIKFMKDPTEPPPPPPPEKAWSDEDTHVVHLDVETFKPFLKKKKHVLLMFYAPWCGHCKTTKPEFNIAADFFKDDPKIALAAVDCMEQKSLCSAYSVKGFPTIKYFSFLKSVQDYNGGRTADDLKRFLTDPDGFTETKRPAAAAEPFGTYPGSADVLILNDDDFDKSLAAKEKALIMFYAPWCGHCTKMKGAFSEAAEKVVRDKIGVLGAVDATVNRALSERFKIKGFPTLKYFENGQLKTEYNGARTVDGLYEFFQQNRKDEL